MSVGPVLTLGVGAFTGGGVQFVVTLGYGTGGTTPVTPPSSGGPGAVDGFYYDLLSEVAKKLHSRRKRLKKMLLILN